MASRPYLDDLTENWCIYIWH